MAAPPQQQQQAPRLRNRDAFEEIEKAFDTWNQGESKIPTLTANLPECNVNELLDLFEMKISSGWLNGLAYVIASLSSFKDAAELNKRPLLSLLVKNWPKNEEEGRQQQLLELTQLLLAKGYDPNKIFLIREEEKCDFISYYRNKANSTNRLFVNEAQLIIQQKLLPVLQEIAPDLNSNSFKTALHEAIGTDNRQCCDILLGNALSNPHQQALAIIFYAAYNRLDLLRSILPTASPECFDIVRNSKEHFDHLDNVISLPGGPIDKGALEVAVRCNNPKSVALIIEHLYGDQHKNENVSRLLWWAEQCNHRECEFLLLDHFNIGPMTSERFVQNLFTHIRQALHLGDKQKIEKVIGKLKAAIATKGGESMMKNGVDRTINIKWYLDHIMTECVHMRCFNGLCVLTSLDPSFLGDRDVIIQDAQLALDRLILHDFGPRAYDAIENLIVFAPAEMNIVPSFELLVKKEKDVHLVGRFLEIAAYRLEEAADKLKSQVKNNDIKKKLEDVASLLVKTEFEIKIEPEDG